jgi:hypothetical protein
MPREKQQQGQKHPLSLRLRPELHEQVKAFATEQGASINETLNLLVERGLGNPEITRVLAADRAYLRESLAQLRQERDAAQIRVNLLTDHLLALTAGRRE